MRRFVHFVMIAILLPFLLAATKKPCVALLANAQGRQPIYYEILPTPELSNDWRERGKRLAAKIESAVEKRAKVLGIDIDPIFGSDTPAWAGFIAQELFENSAQWAHSHDPLKEIRVEIFLYDKGVIVMVTDSGDVAFEPQNNQNRLSQFPSDAAWAAHRQNARSLGDGKNSGMFWDGILDPSFPVNYFVDRADGKNRVLISAPWDLVRNPRPS